MTARSSRPSEHSPVGARRSRSHLSILVGVLAALALTATACSAGPQNASTTTAPVESQSTVPSTTAENTAPSTPAPSTTTQAATELQIKDLVVGKGATAKAGDQVTVDYTGWLMDGTKFDSSIDRHQPFPFTIGAGQVIEGWDKGVAGMKVGGTRQLIIPPSMGYGEQGAGGVIPPNATLKFKVKLLAVKSPGN